MNINAELDIMSYSALETDTILTTDRIKIHLHIEAAIRAELEGVGRFHRLASVKDRLSRLSLIIKKSTLNLHADKGIVGRFRVLLRYFNILF